MAQVKSLFKNKSENQSIQRADKEALAEALAQPFLDRSTAEVPIVCQPVNIALEGVGANFVSGSPLQASVCWWH